uniref:SRCR domain-containing protein n=1 Tax=Amphimedon queenslandica TaxID=400682 RepID=A0A1X7SXN5_AMPQE
DTSSFSVVTNTKASCSQVLDGVPDAVNGAIVLSRNNISSTTYYYGTIRVYHNGWGNICDDYYYNSAEANVICHQLGYTGYSSYSRAGRVSYGTDYLSMKWDDVNCVSSSYLSIAQCTYSTIIDYGCVNSNSYDATVYCYTTRIWNSSPFPGMVRLQDGDYSNEGRVEVYCNGQWGTICSDGFDSTDANTLCKQLGYDGYDKFNHTSRFNDSIQPIWNTNMYSTASHRCFGSGNSCPLASVTNCSQLNDVTLTCRDISSSSRQTVTQSTCPGLILSSVSNGALILSRSNIQSPSYYYGVVRVYYNGWGNICDDYSYSYSEANVICHQLGYTGVSSYSRAGLTSYGTDYVSMKWDDVNCVSSSYLSIAQCTYSTYIDSGCVNRNSYDATVYCYTTKIWNSNPYAGMVRLQGGYYSNEGRVEVYCNGQWGTICSTGFSTSDANTICRQLGYDSGSRRYDSLYGNTSQPIWSTNMYSTSYATCFGSSNSCPSSSITSCSHSSDVSVTCSEIYSTTRYTTTLSICSGLISNAGSAAAGTIVLYRNGVSSSSYYYGIVQLYYNSIWGNICDDNYYSSSEADVICHQLGYTGASSYSRAGLSNYGTDTNQMIIDDVKCGNSNYLTLSQCSFSTYIDSGCTNTNSYDATVYCCKK